MPQYWCYVCNDLATINNNGDLICQVCQQDFLEERRVVIPNQIFAIIEALIEREVLEESFNTEQPHSKPASENFVNNLHSVMLSDNELNEKCPICFDGFKSELKGCKLPCGHIFHENCIKEWLSKHNNKCPVCRVEFQSSEEV